MAEGTPEGALDVIAVEVGAPQLPFLHSMSPQAAVCLNIAEDHVDLFGSMADYVAAKARIYERTEVAAVFQPGDHGSTYSGTAVAGAAVNAVIAEMRRLDAPAMARAKGAHLASALEKVDGVVAVRGQGLLRAADLGTRDAKAVYLELLRRGLVTNAVNANSLRLAPPLTVSLDEIDEAVSLVASVLADGIGVAS